MSVIYGVFDRNDCELEGESIRVMEDTLEYWDVDDKGSWKNKYLFLGHYMLWNTPESKLENLPASTQIENKNIVITSDIRLDNREALIEQLGIFEISHDKIRDSDLILEAYKKWEEECPKYLLGDFVFVIWDENKEQLFCARDHIGIKPFYYFLDNNNFVFSNDIRGVVAHPDVSKKYNDKSIAMFLTSDFGFYDKKDTFYENIQKLPAGTSIVIKKESISVSTYWDIENISNIYYDTYEEYVEKLRNLLYDAVKVRLRTAFPVASHLSGGLDSSTITVLAARELEKKKKLLYTFNWIQPPEEEHDPTYYEWGYANELEKLENIEQKSIKLTPEYSVELYENIDISLDDSSFFWNEYLVRKKAENCGVRSILSGWGGDELISASGGTYFAGLVQQGHFKKVIQELKTVYKDKNFKYLRLIGRYLKLFFYVFIYIWVKNIYLNKIYKNNSLNFLLEPFASSVKRCSFWNMDFLHTEMRIHKRQKAFFKNGHLLQRIENWASSAIGNKIEYSYPLLDKRIIEFALAIPEELYSPKKGQYRLLFKDAIKDFVPEKIVRAGKNYEPVHWKNMHKVWYESLRIWAQNNEKSLENNNKYINRKKLIDHIKLYSKDQNNKKGISDMSLVSILVSNLKTKDC